ncbi:MAG: hypothetical protein WC308_02345 [archaeon]
MGKRKVDENDEPIVDSVESKSESKELSDDIYDEDQSEEQLEEDEISPGEAGFMEGYDSPKMIRCKKCKKKLESVDLEHCTETEEDGETVWTCGSCCKTGNESEEE